MQVYSAREEENIFTPKESFIVVVCDFLIKLFIVMQVASFLRF